MRAIVKNKKLTAFLQTLDVFSKQKVIFDDLDLNYAIAKSDKERRREIQEKISDENEIAYLEMATFEFKEDLIVLFGKEKPLYINPNIQVISTGKNWIRLIDVLRKHYPSINFVHDNYFTNIKIEN